jgi:RNA polymerase sigma-70 factor (ECF subfamily)
MDEEALIQTAREGDRGALRILYDQNKQRIFALAYQYTRNCEDAEDILQETFIKAFRSLPKFNTKNGSRFSPWLYRIGINCSLDYLRRNKKRKENNSLLGKNYLENISPENDQSDPIKRRQKEEVREKIDQILHKLSGQQRMVFVLKHYQQLTIKEIAECMNITEGGVKKHLFRAVSKIRESLKGLISENNYEMQKI